jgi:hypothetical protein
MAARKEILDIAGREVTITNPDKVFFPRTGHTKLDLVRYYLAVADGALRGVDGRPMALKRYVNGVEGEAFYQKRAPQSRPERIETVELRFPSGRTAEEIVVRDAARPARVVNLGCVDLHPHPVRADDLEHPDELRVDLSTPYPGRPGTTCGGWRWWPARSSTGYRTWRRAGGGKALAGPERWKARYPEVWAQLAPADVLVDSMRGRSSTWRRIRLNLRNVPEAQRPSQEALEVDFDPWKH